MNWIAYTGGTSGSPLSAVQKPDWKQYAAVVAPLAACAGLIAATPVLLPAEGDPTSAAALGVAVGTNLLASGLAALCKPGRLFAGKEFEERLANHDIVRLVRTAWGEASDAAVKAYAQAHPSRPTEALSLLSDAPPASFIESLLAAKPGDFVPEVDAAIVRRVIEMSRRKLLSSGSRPPAADEARILEQVAQFKAAFVDSIVTVARERYASDLPSSFRPFL
jgi:hypothetical protein